MEKIIEQVEAWDFWEKLPSELYGFQLEVLKQQDEPQYWMFAYANPARHRRFAVLYDASTKEYIARVTIGLSEFCDIAFITPNLEKLTAMLETRMDATLKQLAVFDASILDCILHDKKIMEWEYEQELPEEIAGFSLFIRPSQPIKGINGSYIVLDYSDWETESNLMLYYNMYRDEFFGEIRMQRTPQMAAEFECKTLPDLKTVLATHLRPKLEKMRQELQA